MATNLSVASVYIKCSNGFGNKVFDLISGIYLKNKFGTNIYYAIDQVEHEVNPNNPFFGRVFYQSHKKINYISIRKYNDLKESLPIEEIWIDSLDKIPNKITFNVRFRGLYRFAYTMYSSLSDNDKNLFEINPHVLNQKFYDKYINHMSRNYACVHIRYGDKLCYGLEDFKHTKYTPYTLPIYTPQYYVDQINELLKKDLEEILIVTDSIGIVKKYIMEKIILNPKIVLFDSTTIDSFYLMTKSKYIIMSHSTFSFASAYFNPTAVCYLLKKYMVNVEKDYIFEDDAISPNWIIIDNKDYLLNFNQNLLKKMVEEYADCNKYIHKQIAGKRAYSSRDIADLGEQKIKNDRMSKFITNGPITFDNTKIKSKLIIYGTLNYDKLDVNGISKIYGTVYGKNGYFNKLNIYGQADIEKTSINNIVLNGSLYADKIEITNKASVAGPIYVSNTNINTIEILSKYARFDDCMVNMLIINNRDNNPKKIVVNISTINKIIVKGKPLNINASDDSIIGRVVNGTIIIDKDL
jgi:hypothetical protein